MILPERPIGDTLTTTEDVLKDRIRSTESIMNERGDYEAGDYEAGDILATIRGAVMPHATGGSSGSVAVAIPPGGPLTSQMSRVVAALGHGRVTATVAKTATAAPSAIRQAAQIAQTRGLVQPSAVSYVRTKGADITVDSAVPDGAHLRVLEARAISNAIASAPFFQPRVFPVPVVGPNFAIDIDAALDAGNAGPLPSGVLYPWAGFLLRFGVSNLNALVGGTPVELLITQGAGNVRSIILELKETTVEVFVINAVLQGAKPRVTPFNLTVAPIATGFFNVTISGLTAPPSYAPTLRLFQLGDREIDAFAQIIG